MSERRERIGDYLLGMAGRGGRVLHMIHETQVGYPTPAAACGQESSSWLAPPGARTLRLCKDCAQHTNDRGISGYDLHPASVTWTL